MSIQTVHQIAPISIDPTASLPTRIDIPDITNLAITTNAETRRDIIAGSVYPSVAVVQTVRPSIQFTTKAIDLAMLQFGLGGYCSPPAGPAIGAWMAKMDCSGVEAGSVHDRFNTTDTFVVVFRRLACTHPNDAEITYEIICGSDGVAAPLTRTTGVSLPGDLVFTRNQFFGMGPAKFKSVSITGKTSVTIEGNIDLNQLSADGELFDSFVGVKTIQPNVDFNGYDLTWTKDTGGSGVADVTGTVDQYIAGIVAATGVNVTTEMIFSKRTVAPTTAQHVRVITQGLAVPTTPAQGSAGEPATVALQIQSHESALGGPLLYSTAAQF